MTSLQIFLLLTLGMQNNVNVRFPPHLRTLTVLSTTALKGVARGSKLMTWKIISGVLTLMGLLCTVWVMWEIETGVAHQRGDPVIRSEDSFGFWLLTATNVIVIGLFFYGAWRAWRQSNREPNF